MTLAVEPVPFARAYPPRVTAFTRRFWEALAEGALTTTQCAACGRLAFPPRPFCPHCWARDVRWTALSGNGRLYSHTVVHAAPAVFRREAPYRVGIVDLDEGLRIATRLLPAPEPVVDGPVAMVVQAFTDGPLYAARPISPSHQPIPSALREARTPRLVEKCQAGGAVGNRFGRVRAYATMPARWRPVM